MKPQDTENQNTTPQAEPSAEAPGDAAPQESPDPVAVLEAEKAELKDKMLRLMADMENLRRRTEREIADARAYAVTNFARDMLNVADNVRRAIESVPDDVRQSAEGAFKGLIEGIDLTERDLLKTLERHGVRKLDPQGQKFDPNLHQAMFEVPNPDVPNGTVVQVVQSGYVIGDRVLRPALVGVARGGPKAPGNGAAQDADNPSTAS
ncbi:nucleotide exchange factor GrpE [Microvirga thermotolerans]|uniref:Protein GrpE n=1 Tax=Microvirga thermotolerans TaxID=2651334 RepID=A0A5P9K1S8_9HYPH|nr:nucleotide exchange factor GrpE [Microvirga thermotolerans]QFU17575.1 nucleotide exchange factor GrpE [Microvirga thermotolerans]